MKVTGKKLLIRQDQTATETEGGLVLPDTTVTKLPRGTVVLVGPDCNHKVLKVGQKVLINDIGGLTVEVKKEFLLVIEEDDVLVILGEDD